MARCQKSFKICVSNDIIIAISDPINSLFDNDDNILKTTFVEPKPATFDACKIMSYSFFIYLVFYLLNFFHYHQIKLLQILL